MILRWIKNLAPKDTQIESTNQSKEQLVDVAQKAIEYQGSLKKRELESLVKEGWPATRKKKFRSKVKQKVWDKVQDSFEGADDQMVEDITDRIVDAAENDPFYKRIFGK